MTEQDFTPVDLSGLVEEKTTSHALGSTNPEQRLISKVDAPTPVGDDPIVEFQLDDMTGESVEIKKAAAFVDGLMIETGSPKGDSSTVAPKPAFYTAKESGPAHVLKKEKPHHRLMCLLFAQGYTPTEVAEQTGFDRFTVNNVRNQDWAQKLILELQHSHGERAIKNIFTGAAADIARGMVETALGKTDAAPAVQLNAQKEVLNRLFGVAPQHIKHEQVNPEDLSTEELRSLIKQN